jgi:small conductance mechanosensitive channel
MWQTAVPMLTAFGLKALGALALWIAGRWLIGFATRLMRKTMERQAIEETLIRWLVASVNVALNIALVVAILGYFGIETTTFAALIAAAGVAIGAAWAGLLANFAAGIFLIILRPFQVGDSIEVGGISGTVKEIGIFATTLVTPDNVVTFVGNNKVFSGNILNYTANPYRRVDLTLQLAEQADHRAAMELARRTVAGIDNVLTEPAPVVAMLDSNMAGPVLAVRPFTNDSHYWQVYFDANRRLREAFAEAGFPTPQYQYKLQTV